MQKWDYYLHVINEKESENFWEEDTVKWGVHFFGE